MVLAASCSTSTAAPGVFGPSKGAIAGGALLAGGCVRVVLLGCKAGANMLHGAAVSQVMCACMM